MNAKLVAIAALVAAASSLLLISGRGEPKPKTKGRVRVGVVFDVGGRGDKSFNDAAYRGAERAERELDADVSFLEPTGAEDREAALRLFASRELDLVVGVGFIFGRDVDAVARDYPREKFACVDYAVAHQEGPMPPNVRGLVFREEEGSYLVGAVAGLMTKTKHVGFIGGMTIPLIRRFERGYREGVKAVCDTCSLHVGYAGSTPEAFKDPERGKTISITQMALGADVLFHAAGSTGHGVFEAAHDAKIAAIGVDSDQFDEMPDVIVTSMVKRVDVALFETIRDVIEGRFDGGIHALGVKEGGVDYIHEGPHAVHLSPDIRAKVDSLKAELASGVRVVAPE